MNGYQAAKRLDRLQRRAHVSGDMNGNAILGLAKRVMWLDETVRRLKRRLAEART